MSKKEVYKDLIISTIVDHTYIIKESTASL